MEKNKEKKKLLRICKKCITKKKQKGKNEKFILINLLDPMTWVYSPNKQQNTR